MSAYLLDTNHASPLVTLHHPLRQKVLDAIDVGDTFAINVVVLAETLYGIRVVPRGIQNRAIWSELQQQLLCYIPDAIDADQAVDLQILLRRQGAPIGDDRCPNCGNCVAL